MRTFNTGNIKYYICVLSGYNFKFENRLLLSVFETKQRPAMYQFESFIINLKYWSNFQTPLTKDYSKIRQQNR